MRNLFALSALFFVVTNLHAQPPGYVPTDGLVGWWPFNGNANDESGNGNTGELNGPTLDLDRCGVPNAAYAFDGVDDRIDVASNLIASDTIHSYSISLWFKSEDTTAAILMSDRSDNDYTYKYTLALRGDLAGAGRFGTHDGVSLVNDLPSAQTGLNNNAWTHLVAVLDMSTSEMRLYINGLVDTVTTVQYPSAWNPSPTGTVFGAWLYIDSVYYQQYEGLLDDIGVWNRALTADEVYALYNTSCGPCISATPVTYSGLDASYTTLDEAVTLIGSPVGGVFIGPGMSGSTFDPVAAGEGTHGISYVYLDSNNCVNSYSLCTSVSIGMALEDPAKMMTSVRVFPNPNHGQFTVELELQGLVSLQVFDARGRQVHNEVFQANGSKTQRTLDLSGLATGGYTVQVRNAGAVVTQQVIVE